MAVRIKKTILLWLLKTIPVLHKKINNPVMAVRIAKAFNTKNNPSAISHNACIFLKERAHLFNNLTLIFRDQMNYGQQDSDRKCIISLNVRLDLLQKLEARIAKGKRSAFFEQLLENELKKPIGVSMSTKP